MGCWLVSGDVGWLAGVRGWVGGRMPVCPVAAVLSPGVCVMAVPIAGIPIVAAVVAAPRRRSPRAR